MIIQLDLESEKPIYQQLVDSIKEGIAVGELSPGESLPSVRAMAADIGINMHTVNKAYQILKNEDFLLIHRQKGVLVNPILPGVNEDFVSNTQEDLRTLIVEALCRGMDEETFLTHCRAVFEHIEEKKKR